MYKDDDVAFAIPEFVQVVVKEYVASCSDVQHLL